MGDGRSLPTYIDLLWPTICAVRELGHSAHISAIDRKAIDLGGFSAEQQARLHGQGPSTELEYRLAWARTALKGMSVLEKAGGGVWRTTELGRSVTTREVMPRHDAYRAGLQAGIRSSARTAHHAADERAASGGDVRAGVHIYAQREPPPGALYHEGPLPDPALTLEQNFANGGKSLIRAVFETTFFADPAVVRQQTPYFPGFARYSRANYGNGRRGDEAEWQGMPVRLDDNSRAQLAWQRYTGRPLSRGIGYGLRHIWGHPWDPTAYTAGWNLAYMPHWAGMLTETQHAHEVIQQAVRQASWNLFFREDSVCDSPEFVADPGVALDELLEGQPLLVLAPVRAR